MDWLAGRWNVDQHTIELIMAADKQAQQEWFHQLEEEGVDFLILDRYTMSQDTYSIVNGVEYRWTLELQRFMRQPDIQILIDIPAEISISRKGKHNDGENDRYESDLEMLKQVRHQYRRQIVLEPKAFFVDGLLAPDQVHYQIVGNLRSILKL